MKKLSIPTPRSSKNFKEVIKQNLADGTIYLGNQIAPKTVISSSISKEGNLTENKVIVYSRIIGLQKIILSELSRLQKSGILLVHNDEYYDTLTEDKIRQRLQFLGEETNASCQDMRLKLKVIERTFKLKMWHDHSDILNHSYVNFMTTILYDAANFMTDNEYQTLARTTSTTNVPSIVEKPQLYILGRSVKITGRANISTPWDMNTSENNHQKTVWLPFPQFSCTHLPEVYRIVNTKSILCEQEERSFGSLRRIAETTNKNRKPGWIIDNTIIRYNAQQNSDDRSDSFAKQDSTISRQAKRLPHRKNTIFTKKLLTGKSSVVQSHLARIADFIIPGDQIWWHYDGENVVFHDSIDEPNFRLEGPPLSNYRSTSLKKEITNVNSIWKSSTVNISKEKAIPPKKHNGDILDDLSTTEEPTMQDNEQEVEDPALILYDKESCSNQEEQTSILSDILPGALTFQSRTNAHPIQESGKNMVTLTAEVHYAFDAKLSNKEQKGSIDKEIRRLYFINVKEEAENRKGKLACNTSEPVKDVKASLKTIGHQKDQTKVKPVHATKLTAKRKLFETSQETTGKDLILLKII
ncbi:unnamed protein product [Mytilus coruscus]|uniref:Uncharacterized protein n=1 Tax=Mytilus coruscus TaxID=42192 RepID=A0A6J8CB38_MYTCO|nr:unnamed protein product [Mytilus coruscus]